MQFKWSTKCRKLYLFQRLINTKHCHFYTFWNVFIAIDTCLINMKIHCNKYPPCIEICCSRNIFVLQDLRLFIFSDCFLIIMLRWSGPYIGSTLNNQPLIHTYIYIHIYYIYHWLFGGALLFALRRKTFETWWHNHRVFLDRLLLKNFLSFYFSSD